MVNIGFDEYKNGQIKDSAVCDIYKLIYENTRNYKTNETFQYDSNIIEQDPKTETVLDVKAHR